MNPVCNLQILFLWFALPQSNLAWQLAHSSKSVLCLFPNYRPVFWFGLCSVFVSSCSIFGLWLQDGPIRVRQMVLAFLLPSVSSNYLFCVKFPSFFFFHSSFYLSAFFSCAQCPIWLWLYLLWDGMKNSILYAVFILCSLGLTFVVSSILFCSRNSNFFGGYQNFCLSEDLTETQVLFSRTWTLFEMFSSKFSLLKNFLPSLSIGCHICNPLVFQFI